MNWRTIERDTWLMIAAYVCLFGWAVVRTVYQDHTTLVSQNKELRQDIERRNARTISLDIRNLDIARTHDEVNGESTRLELEVVAYNDGEPVALHGWDLQITTPSGIDIHGDRLYMGKAMEGSPSVPFIERENPIPSNQETAGLIDFRLLKVNRDLIVNMAKSPDLKAAMALSAIDPSGKKITGIRYLHDLWLQGVNHVGRKPK